MKKYILAAISFAAFAYTIWFMHFGELTTIEGSLSKTGINHTFLFAIWGIITFTALYLNVFTLFSEHIKKYSWKKFYFTMMLLSATGMALTLSCRFGYEFGAEYYLHCAGSLTFSILTSVIVFTYYMLNFRRHRLYAIATIVIGVLLITDMIFLIAYKQNALIEAVPILFGLFIMPLTLFIDKEKDYASQRA